MNEVNPITDKKKLEAIKRYLKAGNIRDYVLFVIGINSGLRISDLLSLSVDAVKGKERITVKEKKTGKTKDFPLSDNSKKIIADYLKETALVSGALFPSKKGGQPISRVQAYRIINDAGRGVGITEPIGTHTIRKTFGYWAYQQGVGIEYIQYLLNHSSPRTSLAYIGITKAKIDNIYINLNL